MVGRCLFGHLVSDDDKVCPRCFPDYDGGVKGGLSLKKDTPTTCKPLTSIHHAKKNIGHKGIRYY